MRVVYTGRREVAARRTRVSRSRSCSQVADVVSLHCPLTDETRHLIGAAALRPHEAHRRARQHDARPGRRRGGPRRGARARERSRALRSTCTSASPRCIPGCSSSRTSSSRRTSAARPREAREAMGMLCVGGTARRAARRPSARRTRSTRKSGRLRHEPRRPRSFAGWLPSWRPDGVDHGPRAAAHLRVRRAHRPPRRAGARRAAAVDRRGAGRRPRLRRARRAVRRTRRRDGAVGRRASACRRRRHLARPHEPDPRDRPRERPRDVEPGVTNLASDAGGHAARLLLRARPVEPAGVHDRRQRGRELGRRALPEVRLHGQPRHGTRGRAAGR